MLSFMDLKEVCVGIITPANGWQGFKYWMPCLAVELQGS